MLNDSFRMHCCYARTCVSSVLLTLLAGMSALAGPAQARTITVRQDGTGDYSNIQPALDAAVTGDQVIVGDGVYQRLGNCNLTFGGKSITLQSSSGAEKTIIDGENHDRAFVFAAGEAVHIKGFTIRNCFASQGGAIYSEGSPRISFCTLQANRASEGSAIFIAAGQPSLEVLTIQGNLIVANAGSAIKVQGGTPSIKYCVIAGNQGDAVVMNSGRGAQFMACTFADNGGYSLRRGTPIVTGTVQVKDCILRDELSPDWLPLELIATHTDVQGGWPGEANIDADPMFVASNDYHLRAGSPCIDAGDDEWCRFCTVVCYPWCPKDGNADGIFMSDMGALEYDPSVALLAKPSFIPFAANPNGIVENRTIELLNAGPSPVQWTAAPSAPWLQVAPSSGAIAENAESLAVSISTAGLTPGTYEGTITVSDIASSVNQVVVSVKLLVSNMLHVPTQEYPNIQAAIDAAANGDVILIAPGTYTGEGNRNISFKGKAITVRGESGANATTIDARASEYADNTSCAFLFINGEPPAAVLDGLTMLNYPRHGIRCEGSSPTIQNCVLAGHRTPIYPMDGDGVFCSNASPILVNCDIREHHGAAYGAGIEGLGPGRVNLKNCRIYRNSGGSRGAIIGSTRFLLERCTITENESMWGAAGIRSTTELVASDCIIDANSGGPVLLLGGQASITNSRICDNYGGAISSDANLTLTNCTLAYNALGSANSPGIYWSGGDLQVHNCVLWANANDRSAPLRVAAGVPLRPVFFFSDVCNLQNLPAGSPLVGPGVISADPRFIDPSGADGYRYTWQDNDYRIAPGSPCADRGSDTAPRIASHDLAGELRVQFCHVDIGAYELGQFVDCNANSSPDSCDIVDGLETDCDANFVPDSCDNDSDGDRIIDVCDNCDTTINPEQTDGDSDGVGDVCDACLNTVPNALVDSSGCPAIIPGDDDRDGDVDDQDLNHWAFCGTGPTPSTLPPGCENADFDLDLDVDQSDFGIIQRCLSGQDVPADPNCQ